MCRLCDKRQPGTPEHLREMLEEIITVDTDNNFILFEISCEEAIRMDIVMLSSEVTAGKKDNDEVMF